MSKLTGYYQSYICNSENCKKIGQVQKHFVWSNEVETKIHKCISYQNELSINNISEEYEITESPALLGLHKERNLTERKKRNHKHFLNDVLPYQDTDTKRHHLNKMGKKL